MKLCPCRSAMRVSRASRLRSAPLAATKCRSKDLGLRVLPQVLRDGVQRNALVGLYHWMIALSGFSAAMAFAVFQVPGRSSWSGSGPGCRSLQEIAPAGLVHELARDDGRVLLRPADDRDLGAFVLQRTGQRGVVLGDAALEPWGPGPKQTMRVIRLPSRVPPRRRTPPACPPRC